MIYNHPVPGCPSPVPVVHKLGEWSDGKQSMTVVTPSIARRRKNLPVIRDSLTPLAEGFNLSWMVVYSPERGGSGGHERNAALDVIHDPEAWVYHCDDDNTVHETFAEVLLREIGRHPEALCFSFAMLWGNLVPWCGATNDPEKLGHDTASFVVKRKAIGHARWVTTGPGVSIHDLIFYKDIHKNFPRHQSVAVDEFVATWNRLQPWPGGRGD
jgi:hypothetical protein